MRRTWQARGRADAPAQPVRHLHRYPKLIPLLDRDAKIIRSRALKPSLSEGRMAKPSLVSGRHIARIGRVLAAWAFDVRHRRSTRALNGNHNDASGNHCQNTFCVGSAIPKISLLDQNLKI